VVTPDGVVGKIVEAFPSTSQVLLINDRESGVGALFAASRTHGVVKGSGDPNPRLDYIVNDEKVKPGDVLLTSGDDRIFPKGLLIGTVIDSKPALPFQLIHVQPAARLDRLEDVLVLLSQQEFEPKKTGEASVPLIPDAPPEPTAPATDPSAASGAAAGAKPVPAPAAANASAANTTAAAPPASSTKPNDSAAKPHGAAPAQNPPVAAKPAAAARQ
jgi:rod shape-determining protein MreC